MKIKETFAKNYMSKTKYVALDSMSLTAREGSSYPPPFSNACAARSKRALGDAFSLTDFGVNLVSRPPGTWSSQRHWHSAEDEFVYVLEGHPTLVTDDGHTPLKPGMCAGFLAGDANGHHLVNQTEEPVVYLEVGSRRRKDDVHYPDIDLQIFNRYAGGTYQHRNGKPYEKN